MIDFLSMDDWRKGECLMDDEQLAKHPFALLKL